MLIASMANGLGAGGGFCAGSAVVCSHQVSLAVEPRIRDSFQKLTRPIPADQFPRFSHFCVPPRVALHHGFHRPDDVHQQSRALHRPPIQYSLVSSDLKQVGIFSIHITGL